VRQISRELRGFNVVVVREVDAGSCKQSGVRQSVAGIVVDEKNRCMQSTPRHRLRRRFHDRFLRWQGQFQGQQWGQMRSA